MDQSVLGYDKYEKRKRYPKESSYISIRSLIELLEFVDNKNIIDTFHGCSVANYP